MLLVYLGLAAVLKHRSTQLIIGVLGGLMLVWMGYGMIRKWRQQAEAADHALSMSPVLAGVVTTVGNPYFFLWWASVGAMLVSRSLAFGLSGVLLFMVTHWLCDLGWNSLVSYLTYRSRRLWSPLVHRAVFTACGVTLAGFGLYFALSTLL
jgi:threonine/homoserine/homoserine lactone efflux protein